MEILRVWDFLQHLGNIFWFYFICSPAYVFNGAYLPITCKVVQETLERSKPTSSNLSDYYKELENILGVQARVWDVSGNDKESGMSSSNESSSKMVLIFIIGGYTLAEVAAFRNMQTSMGYHFVICSTCNITGRTLIHDILNCDNIWSYFCIRMNMLYYSLKFKTKYINLW